MLSFYGGKFLSRKAFRNGVDTFSQGRSKVADDARSGVGVAEGFRASVKRRDKCINVGGGYVEK
jgi:hypothetical protein